ncbi:MAG: glycogen/starch synthase [bacterium]
MKILFVSAEVGPFVSVGGLSQVSYFLPRALAQIGLEVAVFTPKFGAMEATAPTSRGWKLQEEYMGLKVPVENESECGGEVICNIKSYQRKTDKVKTYFLENREYYELRANVFGYKDDHVRFMLMCRGCLEWLLIQKKRGSWWPDMIHLNDWHSAYLVELARQLPRYKEALKRVAIGITVHNFTFQGNYEYKYCLPEDRDKGTKPLAPLLSEELVKQNPLLRGIKYADAVTTVSPTHAREVLTSEYGEGLENLLQEERDKLSGILNGLDTKEFDPATDPIVPNHYNKMTFETARQKNKCILQEEFGLPGTPRAFLMAFSGRLANQKGMTLLIEVMTHLLPGNPDFQLIVLGGGDDAYRRTLTELAKKYPKQVGLHLLPNFKLPRKIFAGTDVLLIPSLFEPGGIVALESLRYGAVPIVRRTGGLNDIVVEFDPMTGKGNGFSFIRKDAWAFYGAIMTAATTYRNPRLWKRLVKNCLSENFSWQEAAKQYKRWYKRTGEKRKRILIK